MKSGMNLDYDNLRSLFSQTPEMLCILSGPEHRFEFVNEAHIRVLGFNATGRTVRDAQPESIEIHGILDDVYLNGTTAELSEIPITLADRLRYFNLTYSPRRDQHGVTNGVMILGTEVTDQILFRQAQQAQNNWLKLVLDHIPTPVFLIDPETTAIIFSNQNATQLLGVSVENTTSQERLSIHHFEAVRNGVVLSSEELPSSRAARGEIFKDEEFTLRTPRGSIQLLASSDILPSSYDVKKTALLILNDVTALRRSEERLSMAVEVARIGFYDWDFEKDIILFSDQVKADWGLDSRSSHSVDFALSLIHPDDRKRVNVAIQNAMSDQSIHHIQFRINRPDGHLIWVEVKGQATYNDHNEPIRFFGTSLDITAEKLIEEELILAKSAAEGANAAKSAFLANMSHEIRTPLGAIMGFVELMKKKRLKPEELETYLNIISRNSGQLVRIIDDILDLSKVEAGHMLIEKINFNLSDLISDFASLISFKATEKGISFEVRTDSSIPEHVYSDPTRIRQVLNNIVGNAIKFTHQGSIDLLVSYSDEQLEFTVTDTGVGMSPDEAEKVFQAFAQADVSTTRKFGGTGLGLVLTQNLCALLDGDFVLVQTVPQKGSVFRACVRAPKSDQIAKSLTSTTLNESLALEGAKILVVDDSADNRTLISLTLTEMGATVDLAIDGEEGASKALSSYYDIVLMDLQMPVLDGHSAIKRLRENHYTRPIIALTAHAMREEREKCLTSGFDGFLSKPLDRDMLQSTLASHLAKNHSILIIEDDEDLRDLMLLFLQDEGQNVFWVSSAEEALTYLKEHPLPPLVLLDLTLPKMTGEEFMKQIQKRADRSRSRIIVASGWNDLEKKCKEVLADGFLKKPFHLEQLEALIEKRRLS
jgi:PAS domain S-box-containing protein